VAITRAAAQAIPLRDRSAQVILTDPPYNIGIPYPGYDDRLPWPDYWQVMEAFLAEACRVLRPGGVLAIMVPASVSSQTSDGPIGHNRNRRERRREGTVIPVLAMWTSRVAQLLLYEDTVAVAYSFSPEGDGIALGTAIGGSARPRLRTVARFLIVAYKDKRTVSGRDGKRGPGRGPLLEDCKNHWYVRPAWGKGFGHPTPMPEELAGKVIRLWSNPGDLVVDPFCGSGVVLDVARRMGRRGFGCDLSRAAVEIAARRLAQHVLPLGA